MCILPYSIPIYDTLVDTLSNPRAARGGGRVEAIRRTRGIQAGRVMRIGTCRSGTSRHSSIGGALPGKMALAVVTNALLGSLMTLELTPDTFDETVFGSGKSVFIKFCESAGSRTYCPPLPTFTLSVPP